MNHDLLDAYLAVFANEGWTAATLGRVARRAGATPADVLAAAGDPYRALDRIADRDDRAALATAAAPGPGMSPRDVLFDLVMARFDAMRPWRDGHAELARAARTRPALAVALLTLLGRTSARLLSAADQPTVGPAGVLRANAFAAALADVGRVWLGDDDPDLGQTMRALDERLTRLEQWRDRLARGRSGPPLPDPAAAV